MPKLHPDKQLKLNKRIVGEILKAFNLSLTSYAVLPGGIENTTVLVVTNQGKFALRVYRKDKKTLKDIYRELAFMEFLRNAKIPAPSVLENIFKNNVTRFRVGDTVWKCVLMEYMLGKHPTSYPATLLKQLATAQARMHILGKEFAKMQNDDNKPFWKMLRERHFSPHIKLQAIKNLEVRDFISRVRNFEAKLPASLPNAYNHLDITHDNILSNKGKLSAILDFDDVYHTPSVICLAYTLFDVLYITKQIKAVKKYLALYSKKRPLTRKEKLILKDVMLFRNYVMGALEVYFWGEKGKRVHTALRLEEIITNLVL